MSVFGKYGVGGTNPGKFPNPPYETTLDVDAASTGTEKGNPDSRPEVKPVDGSHN